MIFVVILKRGLLKLPRLIVSRSEIGKVECWKKRENKKKSLAEFVNAWNFIT